MRICMPTDEDKGLHSVAYGHFGSAPFFIISDTQSGETTTINNKDQDHVHGACHPTAALDGERVDVVIVGGIGGRALAKLSQMGIKTYQSKPGTVAENLEALKAGNLSEMSSQHACPGHGHDHH